MLKVKEDFQSSPRRGPGGLNTVVPTTRQTLRRRKNDVAKPHLAACRGARRPLRPDLRRRCTLPLLLRRRATRRAAAAAAGAQGLLLLRPRRAAVGTGGPVPPEAGQQGEQQQGERRQGGRSRRRGHYCRRHCDWLDPAPVPAHRAPPPRPAGDGQLPPPVRRGRRGHEEWRRRGRRREGPVDGGPRPAGLPRVAPRQPVLRPARPPPSPARGLPHLGFDSVRRRIAGGRGDLLARADGRLLRREVAAEGGPGRPGPAQDRRGRGRRTHEGVAAPVLLGGDVRQGQDGGGFGRPGLRGGRGTGRARERDAPSLVDHRDRLRGVGRRGARRLGRGVVDLGRPRGRSGGRGRRPPPVDPGRGPGGVRAGEGRGVERGGPHGAGLGDVRRERER